MKLGQSEPLGILDHHDRSIGHIDSYLDHRGGYQDLYLAASEPFHDIILLGLAHPPMEAGYHDAFSHLFLHLFQRDRFIFKISSIEYIRVIASAVASTGTEGSSLAASAKASTIAGRAALLSDTSFCSRCALSCCDCFRLLLFSGGFCLCLCWELPTVLQTLVQEGGGLC